jgi:hypothetical protein
MRTFLNSALCALAALAAATAAQAQSTLPPVGISASRAAAAPGTPLRADVSRVCPAYAKTLQDARVWVPDSDSPLDVLVRFKLDAGRMDAVTLRGIPVEYRAGLRRLVREIDCIDDGQPQQGFAFILRVMPEGQGDSQAVAISPGSPLLAAAH